jgi:hypothetical protein
LKFSDAKRKTLILMREWTSDGSIIPDADNADYLKSMDDLANTAQQEIAKKQKVHAVYRLPSTPDEVYGGLNKYAMPTAFLEPNTVMYVADGKLYEDPNTYRWLDRKTILIDPKYTGTFDVHYFKRPAEIIPNLTNTSANDNYEFEVDLEAQDLIPVYMAAMLLMDENPSLATMKLNVYYAKLNELQTNGAPHRAVRNAMGW